MKKMPGALMFIRGALLILEPIVSIPRLYRIFTMPDLVYGAEYIAGLIIAKLLVMVCGYFLIKYGIQKLMTHPATA